jgi:hypothetical protein
MCNFTPTKVRHHSIVVRVSGDPMRRSVIESHSEASPSLRVDKPFPALLQAARALDFDSMDTTDHGHIPYVYILVRALDDWRAAVRHPHLLHPHASQLYSTTGCRLKLTQKSENLSRF